MNTSALTSPDLLYSEIDGMQEVSTYLRKSLKGDTMEILSEFGNGFLSAKIIDSKANSKYPFFIEISLGYKDFQTSELVSNTSIAFLSLDKRFNQLFFKNARLDQKSTPDIEGVVQVLVNSINNQKIDQV